MLGPGQFSPCLIRRNGTFRVTPRRWICFLAMAVDFHRWNFACLTGPIERTIWARRRVPRTALEHKIDRVARRGTRIRSRSSANAVDFYNSKVKRDTYNIFFFGFAHGIMACSTAHNVNSAYCPRACEKNICKKK